MGELCFIIIYNIVEFFLIVSKYDLVNYHQNIKENRVPPIMDEFFPPQNILSEIISNDSI